jgi:hypothetical protein
VVKLDVFMLGSLSLISGLAYFWGRDGQTGFPGVAPMWAYRVGEAAGPVVCILAGVLAIALQYSRSRRKGGDS